MTLRTVHIKQLKNLIQIGSDDQLIQALDKIHPAEISHLFSELSDDTQIKRFIDCLFKVKKAGKTLKEIPEFMLPDILELIDDDKLAIIATRLDPDDATYLLSKLRIDRWSNVLQMIEQPLRTNLEKLLLYPPHSAGSVMNPDFFTVQVDRTIGQALFELQSFAAKLSVFYVYVVEGKRLVGVVPLRTLVISDPEISIRSIMSTNVIVAHTTSDQEEAAQIVSQYNLLAIPVVNENHELVGVITVDDVIDIFEEEATEDIYNMAGLSGEDRAFSPVATKVKKRLPWLFINIATAFLSALVVGLFHNTIEQVSILAAYMPVVAGLGGNGGTQSMVVITRSIALGEMEFSRASSAVRKEVLNGLFLGLVAGTVAALIAILVNASPYLGLILFLAMVINMVLAGLMGSSVPLCLKFLKLDPAVGAGIFVTATTDLSGFFIYLGLAHLFLDKLR